MIDIRPFIVGFIMVGGAKFVTQTVGPFWATLVGGFPQGLVASFFIKKEDVRDFLSGYIIQSIVLILALFFINFILQKTKIGGKLTIVISILFWAICSIALIYLINLTKVGNIFSILNFK